MEKSHASTPDRAIIKGPLADSPPLPIANMKDELATPIVVKNCAAVGLIRSSAGVLTVDCTGTTTVCPAALTISESLPWPELTALKSRTTVQFSFPRTPSKPNADPFVASPGERSSTSCGGTIYCRRWVSFCTGPQLLRERTYDRERRAQPSPMPAPRQPGAAPACNARCRTARPPHLSQRRINACFLRSVTEVGKDLVSDLVPIAKDDCPPGDGQARLRLRPPAMARSHARGAMRVD